VEGTSAYANNAGRKKKMSEPVDVVLNTTKQMLRLTCGQCGDTKDIYIEFDPELKGKKILVSVIDSLDMTNQEEDAAIMLMQPVHLIV
jgi:hypothetical protein